MKTSGAVNWFHALAWLSKHISDGLRQGHYKEVEATKKITRKLWKIHRRAVKTVRRQQGTQVSHTAKKDRDSKEISIDANLVKFPPVGLGCIVCLEQPQGPTLPDTPSLDSWVRRGFGDLPAVLQWKEQLLQWHAGYLSTKFERFADGSSEGQLDERVLEGTATTAQWDSDALSESLHAGEISAEDFYEFLMRVTQRFKAQEHLISCGASRKLRLIAVNIHPQDGTLHFHPVFLLTEPVGFLRQNRTIVPAAMAPNRGKRKIGEGWTGGERCGLIGDRGKLVTNTLGVAMCAADTEQSAGIDPPRETGRNWDFLENTIRVREHGEFVADGKRAKRKRSEGLGTPYDLAYTRIVREEISALAGRFPKLAARRKAKIERAKEERRAVNAQILAFAQPEIEAAFLEGEKRGIEAERARQKESATKKGQELELNDTAFEATIAAIHRLAQETPTDGDEQYINPNWIKQLSANRDSSDLADQAVEAFELFTKIKAKALQTKNQETPEHE